ncbi:MAG: hypothetical protein NC215_00455 [Ruminococcus sp.]|nr:hypothetical protein [Ruminococcus sp.]MCM1391779.1 hypothetical protein [Ruminococcus sp.]
MSKNLMKIIGFAATLIGMGATLLSDWVSDKQMEATVEEKVNEALAEKSNEEES